MWSSRFIRSQRPGSEKREARRWRTNRKRHDVLGWPVTPHAARLVAMSVGDTPDVLITIPISHYCEKARWALDRAGLDYVERPHLQVFHWAAVRRAGGGKTAPVLVRGDRVLA